MNHWNGVSWTESQYLFRISFVDGRAIPMAPRIPWVNKFNFCQFSFGNVFHFTSAFRNGNVNRSWMQARSSGQVKINKQQWKCRDKSTKNVSLIHSIFRTWERNDWRWTNKLLNGAIGNVRRKYTWFECVAENTPADWRRIIRGNSFTFVGAKVKRSDLETSLEFWLHCLLGEQWIPTTTTQTAKHGKVQRGRQ